MEWKTTTQILENLKNSNDSVCWSRFRDHFYPVLLRFAKKLGLADNDAEDVAQETIVTFLKAYRANKYSRQQGKLSHWVLGVARNVIRDYYRKRSRTTSPANSDSAALLLQNIEDEHAIQHTWRTEWRNVLLGRCLTQARKEFDSKTFRAFESYALRGNPIEQVCEELNLSPNAVYIAKSRVLTKIRRLYTNFDEE
jgi:RNA polymerase sigma-70 factor (ECF subfamily)